MSQTSNSVELSGVTLEATGPNELTLSGPGGDVDVIGVDTFTYSGQLNTGTSRVGGYLAFYRSDRAVAGGAPGAYSFANSAGNDFTVGALMPHSGRVIYMAWDSSSAQTNTCVIRGSVSGDLLSVSPAAESVKTASGTASFVAGEYLTMVNTAGTFANCRLGFWVLFD